MATILQQPDQYSFAGNIKNIIVTTEARIIFKLKHGSEVLFESSYDPDLNDKVEIDIKKIIQDVLTSDFPVVGEVTTRDFSSFSFIIDEGAEQFFYAFEGGVDTIIDSSWFAENFLTWQPQTSYVTWSQPQFLSYIALQVCNLKIKGYFSDGTDQTVSFGVYTVNKINTANLQFSSLPSKFAGKQPQYVDVWTEDVQGARLSYIQRFVLKNSSTDDNSFLFKNSLGGWDSVIFSGTLKNEASSDVKTFSQEDATNEYQVDLTEKYSKNTGYFLSEKHRIWISEFFKTSERYYLSQRGYFEKLTVLSSTINSQKSNPSSYNFTFSLSRTTKYLNLTRVESPESPLEIVDPTGDLFFLAPRLVEFPSAEFVDEFLLPVQSPFVQSWMKMSLGAFRNSILDSISDITSPLAHTHTWESITGKPVTFTPSAHNHTWDSIQEKPLSFAPSAHSHSWDSIQEKPLSFTPSAHNHTWDSIQDKPASFTPSAHSHAISGVAGLSDALSGKEPGLGNPVTDGQILSSTVAGVRSWVNRYVLPVATAAILGGVMIGTGISVSAQGLISHSDFSVETGIGGTLGHIKSSERSTWNNHIVDTSSHLSADERTYFNKLKTYFLFAADNSSVRTTINFYSESGVSCFGIGPAGSGGGSSVNVIDNLISTSTTEALSANMGRYLSNLVSSKSDTGHVHTWESITGKPMTFAPAAHTHDLYALASSLSNYWNKSGSWISATLTSLGATRVMGVTGESGASEFAVATLGGQMYPYADGFFYQNEGQYRVLDTSNIGSTVAAYFHTHSFASLADKPTTINGYGITDSNYHYAAVSNLNTMSYFGTFASSYLASNMVVGSAYMSGIQFLIDGNPAYKVQLAINYSDQYLYRRNQYNEIWGGWIKILDTDNYSSYALPLSGGALSGQLRINSELRINSVDFGANQGYIYFGDGTLDRWIGYNGSVFQANVGTAAGGVVSLIHSGNIGSQSVNYATSAGNSDTLDNRHENQFIRSKHGVIGDMNNADNYLRNSTFYWIPNTTGNPAGAYSYGVCLAISDDINWYNQLGFGTNGEIYFRQAINTTDFTGIDWVKLWHSGNVGQALTSGYIPYWHAGNLRFENSAITYNGTHIGIFGHSSGKFEVALPSYTSQDASDQMAIFGSGTGDGYGVRIGYNVNDNKGYINVLKPGVAWGELHIQAGGFVNVVSQLQVGFAALQSHKFSVNGTSLLFGDSIVRGRLLVGNNTNGTAVIDAHSGYAFYGVNDFSVGLKISNAGNAYFSHSIFGASQIEIYDQARVGFNGSSGLYIATTARHLWPRNGGSLALGTSAIDRIFITGDGFTKMSNTSYFNDVSGAYHEMLSNSGLAAVISNEISSGIGNVLYLRFGNMSPDDNSKYLDCYSPSGSKFLLYASGRVWAANYIETSSYLKAESVKLGNWEFSKNGDSEIFIKLNGNTKAKINSAGDILAYGGVSCFAL